jgi:protein involved in polysaccharide export with SLBB domain
MLVALGFLFIVAVPAVGVAQARGGNPSDWDVGRILVGREDLEELITQLEQISISPAYSSALRERARDESRIIALRLEDGDFQAGDQIQITVEGEEQLSATFVVTRGQVLSLPGIGNLPLRGVLRSELDSHLTGHLARYIRDPRVEARSLLRIAIVGSIARPGFYLVPSELPLSDALMVAGGPSATADLRKTRVERGEEQIWIGEALQRALAEGQTLDRMSLRAGDRLVVPAEQAGRARSALQTTVMVAPLVVSLLTLFVLR